MAVHAQRITNGQRAAVCGLIIAGLNVETACKIAGAPNRTLFGLYLPKGWHTKRMPVRKWRGDRLAALKKAWHDRSLTLKNIGELFGVTPGQIHHVAKANGWLRRRRGPISNETRLYYRRLRTYSLADIRAAA